jgi:AcrR family transcriptional regulator
MDAQLSLRERKKVATRRLLARTALDLFEARGFDHVSVAEIADAADVSKKTVFNYFAVKEDVVLGSTRARIGDPAAVVRKRAVGQTPHGALLASFRQGLDDREPFTGLSDKPEALRIRRLVSQTPALLVRTLHYRHESERQLAEALVEESSSEFTARLIAAQIHATQQVLVDENLRRMLAGESADAVYPDAVKQATHGFRWLERGLGDLFRREASDEPSV